MGDDTVPVETQAPTSYSENDVKIGGTLSREKTQIGRIFFVSQEAIDPFITDIRIKKQKVPPCQSVPQLLQ
jgi:hypothetical protein